VDGVPSSNKEKAPWNPHREGVGRLLARIRLEEGKASGDLTAKADEAPDDSTTEPDEEASVYLETNPSEVDVHKNEEE
jgi:hypothetical protein